MHLPMAPGAIIWDGFRHLAALWAGAAPACFLAAETATGGSELVAATDASTGGGSTMLSGVLPAGCRAVRILCALADDSLATIPILLDERLLATRVADGVEGLARVLVSQPPTGQAPGLAAEILPASAPLPPLPGSIIATGLNRRMAGPDAQTRFTQTRLTVGPFQHRDDETASPVRVTAIVGAGEIGLTVRFDAAPADAVDGRPGFLVAQIKPAMTQARHALAALDAELTLEIETALDELAAPVDGPERDASGLSPVAAFRRGFRLLRAQPGSSDIVLPDWEIDDEVLLLADPGRPVIWAGAGDPAFGTPMAIAWREGALAAISQSELYAPSAATGLIFGGMRSGALVVGDARSLARPLGDAAKSACRAAEPLLARVAPKDRSPMTQALEAAWSADRDEETQGALARLTAQARNSQAPGRLLAAAGIDPALADELAGRVLGEQVAMLGWAIAAPALAARACAVRLVLPSPGKPDMQPDLERLLDWYEDRGLPDRLRQAAMASVGQDRTATRLLHDIAAMAHDVWLDQATVAEARDAVQAAASRPGARPLSVLEALLADLRRRPGRKAAAAPTLEDLALLRIGLGRAARACGVREAIAEELDRRQGELTPGDIVLLDAHFTNILANAARLQAARALIATWEAAAGVAGLAERADRSGDSLAGARRLGGTMAGTIEDLARIEALSPVLARIHAEITAALGDADEVSEDARPLRATLAGYGALLLLQSVIANGDAAFAAVPFAAQALGDPGDAGFGAAFRRLRAGTPETLGRYLAAATIVSGVDHDWSASSAALADASRQ